MSGRLRAIIVATGLLAAVAGCQKTTLSKPVPNGISVDLATTSVSADTGTLTVSAQAFQNGVALLKQPIQFSVGGLTAAGGTVSTSSTSGRATFTFTGLTVAGSGTVVVQTGTQGDVVSASAPFSVVAGAPTSLTLSVPSNAIAGQTQPPTWSVAVTDAHANALPSAGASVTTNAPGATVGSGVINGMKIAGTWTVSAQLGALVDSHTIAVAPAAAASVLTALSQTAIAEHTGSLSITCTQMDGFGNDTTAGATFSTVIMTPSATVTKVDAHHFTATSFTAAGPATAQCNDGVHADTKGFQIAAEGPADSVVATLTASQVEAGQSLFLSCKEVDGFGNDLGTNFNGNVFTSAPGATVTALGGNLFRFDGLVVKGLFQATCVSPTGLSDSDNFAVLDTTPPTVTTGQILQAFEPSGVSFNTNGSDGNGVTFDNAYAPGTQFVIAVRASDVVGVASETVSLSDPGQEQYQSVTLQEANPGPFGGRNLVLTLPQAPTFDQITLTVTATDTTGNVSAPVNTVINVDPAAAFGAAGGVVIRTQYQGYSLGGQFPFGMINSNGALYLSLLDTGSGEGTLARVTGLVTSTTVATNYVSGSADLPETGLEFVPGGFGSATNQIFLTDQGGAAPEVVTFDGSTPVNFATLTGTAATGLAYGMVGTSNVLVLVEDNLLYTADATGTVTQLGTGVGTVLNSVAFDGANDLFAGAQNGDVYAIDGAGTGTDLGSTSCGQFTDMLVVGNTLYGAHGGSNVCKVVLSPSFGPQADVSQSFPQATALAVDNAGTTLYVAGYPNGVPTIYKVTGF